MILTDSHLHTHFSSDSDETMDHMIEKACSLGIKELYFTDHMDIRFPQQYKMKFLFDVEKQQNEIAEAQEKYKGQIRLFRGIEAGLMPELEPELNRLFSHHSFDYVIGSVHVVSGLDPYYVEYWERTISEEFGIQAYLEECLSCVSSLNTFDAFGHLDYIARYVPSKTPYNCFELFPELIDEILVVLVKKGKALEVNTSGYAKNGAANPNMEVVKRFLEFGGELVTIGSDAHAAENLGASFDIVKEELKAAGLRYYTTFRSRRPVLHPL